MPAGVGGLGQAGTRDEHVVVPLPRQRDELTPCLAELPLDAAADDGVADRLRDGETEPRLDRVLALLVGAGEPVEDEIARGGRAPLPVDGVEVPGAGEAVPALRGFSWNGGAGSGQAESRLRPFALRRFRIACPALVAMRARKPCLRLRRRTLGW